MVNPQIGGARRKIQLPAEILRHGLYFIDTPGVGSAIVANTKTTATLSPDPCRGSCVSSSDFAVSEADIEFLRTVTAHRMWKAFCPVTDHTSNSRPKNTSFVPGYRLDREPGIGRYSLFAVSGQVLKQNDMEIRVR